MSKSQPTQGIKIAGLDASFANKEAQKSNLLLEAQLLRGERQDEAAAEKFAEAAEIEEALSEACATAGLLEKSWRHHFSAASSWAQAGNFYRAILLCQGLLARSDLPEALRKSIRQYAEQLRLRRAEWYAGLELAAGQLQG